MIFFLLIFALVFISAINIYFSYRFTSMLSGNTKKTLFKVMMGFFSLISIIMVIAFLRSFVAMPHWIKSAFAVSGSFFMGGVVYLFLFLVATEIPRAAFYIFKASDPTRRIANLVTSSLALLLTLSTVIYGYVNANDLKTVTYEVDVSKEAGLGEMRVALLSDLHIGAVGSEERLPGIVDEINRAKPDIVCLAGDIFDNDFSAIKDPDRVTALLKSIKTSHGVYACPGNHDSGKEYREMEELLKCAKITLLSDEVITVNSSVNIIGRLDRSPIGGGQGERKSTEEVLALLDPKLPTIVMDHNPSHIDEYGSNVDLILCGHTHKGQIFPGSLITSMMYTIDYGIYKEGEGFPTVIVSSGVGTWGPPIRVGTSSEIVIIELSF